jgi:hypothetical protein
MNKLFLIFWTVMIFTSLAWYFFLIFYVGSKGGREIIVLAKELGGRRDTEPSNPLPPRT